MFPGMPRNALAAVPSALTAPLADLPALLVDLVRSPAAPRPDVPEAELERDRLELRSARGEALGAGAPDHPGTPSPYSCPDCTGVLFEHRGRQHPALPVPGGPRLVGGGAVGAAGAGRGDGAVDGAAGAGGAAGDGRRRGPLGGAFGPVLVRAALPAPGQRGVPARGGAARAARRRPGHGRARPRPRSTTCPCRRQAGPPRDALRPAPRRGLRGAAGPPAHPPRGRLHRLQAGQPHAAGRPAPVGHRRDHLPRLPGPARGRPGGVRPAVRRPAGQRHLVLPRPAGVGHPAHDRPARAAGRRCRTTPRSGSGARPARPAQEAYSLALLLDEVLGREAYLRA